MKSELESPKSESPEERLARLMTPDPNSDPEQMLNLLNGKHKWKKQPLDYVSSKYAMLDKLMPLIPHRDFYGEACVGCSPIFLNRRRSKLEAINDRYTGITNYYRVVRNTEGKERLKKMIEDSIFSEEMFNYYFDKLRESDKKPYPTDIGTLEEQDIYYAYYWFYTLANSLYSRQEVCRITNTDLMAGYVKEMWNALPKMDFLHQRLQNVVVWNGDVVDFLEYWDRLEGVFYVDPPYIGTAKCFKHNFNENDHIRLLEKCMNMKGWVGISNYQNPLYDHYFGQSKKLFSHKQSNGWGQSDKTECLYIHEGIQ